MRLYHSNGHSWLVCPRLLKLDRRHGRHPAAAPPCASGRACLLDHKHEKPLPEGGGHAVVYFRWFPGCRPPTAAEHPVCPCGEALVLGDLDNLYGEQHLGLEVEPGGDARTL